MTSESSNQRKHTTPLVFLCNYSFITSLVWRQENQHALCSHWISFPLPGRHMCTSDRQSNMTAIYTHWVRWKLPGLSLRPRSPKRMGEKTDKGGKRPVNFYIPGCLWCFPMAGAPAHMQTHGGKQPSASMCKNPDTHTHRATNTAGLWCSRCCFCRACLSSHIIPSTASKTRKQRQTTHSEVSNDTSGVSC